MEDLFLGEKFKNWQKVKSNNQRYDFIIQQ